MKKRTNNVSDEVNREVEYLIDKKADYLASKAEEDGEDYIEALVEAYEDLTGSLVKMIQAKMNREYGHAEDLKEQRAEDSKEMSEEREYKEVL